MKKDAKISSSITLNGENLKFALLGLGTTQRCPFSPFLFNTALEVLARLIRPRDYNLKYLICVCGGE